MKRFKNLLYACLGTDTELEGLKQALSLARNNHARLTVLQIAPALPDRYKRFEEQYYLSIQEKMHDLLGEAYSSLQMTSYSPVSEQILVASEHPDRTIIEYVISGGHDLLIKDTETDGEASGLSALDMSLLRQCPSPVWLCRPIQAHREYIKVAVAVDASDTTDKGRELASELLKIGRAQADECDGNLHVVSCLNSILESELRHNVMLKLPQDQIEQELKEEKSLHLRLLDERISAADIDGQLSIHQLSGVAEDVIPEFVGSHDIDILVMGTQARTGLAGFFIGNTAENVLRRLQCSLFTIKPSGFESPVKPH